MSIATWLQRLLSRKASSDVEYVCRRCERVYRVSADSEGGTVMTGCSCGASASLLPRHYFELLREAKQREESHIANRGSAPIDLYVFDGEGGYSLTEAWVVRRYDHNIAVFELGTHESGKVTMVCARHCDKLVHPAEHWIRRGQDWVQINEYEDELRRLDADALAEILTLTGLALRQVHRK